MSRTQVIADHDQDPRHRAAARLGRPRRQGLARGGAQGSPQPQRHRPGKQSPQLFVAGYLRLIYPDENRGQSRADVHPDTRGGLEQLYRSAMDGNDQGQRGHRRLAFPAVAPLWHPAENHPHRRNSGQRLCHGGLHGRLSEVHPQV